MPRLKQIGIDVEVNGVIEKNRRTFSESENDILRRILIPENPTKAPNVAKPVCRPDEPAAPTRARGQWTVEFRGQRLPAPNLKGAYRTLLLVLSDSFPDFLEHFSKERSRSRRFVAHSPTQLYLTTPELAEDHGELLKDGWFYDTNLSKPQVAKRAREAARVSGLLYGTDVRILDNLEEI